MSYQPSAQAHGFIYASSSGITAITAGAPAVKLTIPTNSGELHHFTMPTNNRLLYTPERATIVHGVCSLSYTFSGSVATCTFSIALNDMLSPHFRTSRFTASSSDMGSIAMNGCSLTHQNDYYEIWASSTKNGNLTITTLMMSAFELHPHVG